MSALGQNRTWLFTALPKAASRLSTGRKLKQGREAAGYKTAKDCVYALSVEDNRYLRSADQENYSKSSRTTFCRLA